jgi:hypothetical protein
LRLANVCRGLCVLLKYRVPSPPYDWHCKCRPNGLAISTLALEDAQRTMGLMRFHASEWHIDPHKIGVLGFLRAAISWQRSARILIAGCTHPSMRQTEKAADPILQSQSIPDICGRKITLS